MVGDIRGSGNNYMGIDRTMGESKRRSELCEGTLGPAFVDFARGSEEFCAVSGGHTTANFDFFSRAALLLADAAGRKTQEAQGVLAWHVAEVEINEEEGVSRMEGPSPIA